MSDERLRELERRWRESGAVEDEAAYLRERVRVGDLTEARLGLAAFCGHEGARRVLSDGSGPSAGAIGGQPWCKALLQGWGGDAVRRLELGALRSLLPLWERKQPHDPLCQELVVAIERHLEDPTANALAEVRRAPRDLAERAAVQHCRENLWTMHCCPDDHHFVLEQLLQLVEQASQPELQEVLSRFGSTFFFMFNDVGSYLGIDHQAVLNAGVGELVAWALGRAEPTRDLAPPPNPEAAPVRLVDPRLQASLRTLEGAAVARPEELERLEQLVELSERVGWRHDGRTLSEYRRALASSGGVPEEDWLLADLVAVIGLRAVPLALEALPRRHAFYVLRRLGGLALAAVEPVAGWLASPSWSDREEAAYTLLALGPSSAGAVRRRLPGLEHKESAVLVLLALGQPPESLASELQQVFAGRNASILLGTDRVQPSMLWPVARELGAMAVDPQQMPTGQNNAINALFGMGARAAPAIPVLKSAYAGAEPAWLERLVNQVR